MQAKAPAVPRISAHYAVIFTAGELVRIAVCGAADRSRAEGLISVVDADCPARADKSYRGAKCIASKKVEGAVPVRVKYSSTRSPVSRLARLRWSRSIPALD
jgi:hypothetical protein